MHQRKFVGRKLNQICGHRPVCRVGLSWVAPAYNAGARADEAAQVLIGDLSLPHVAGRDTAWVLVRGKGNKSRRCPLWAQTVHELTALVQGRDPNEHVFINRCGRPITRFGIHTVVERTVTSAVNHVPSLSKKASIRTRFATRRRPTSYVPEWTPTRSGPGWGTCR
jgi:site-specific recombinase XerC